MRLRPAVLSLIVTLCSCASVSPPPPATPALKALRFSRRVETVSPGIHVAMGYGLANVIWLEGTNGAVVVDTLESAEAARKARAALARVSDQPVRAIIYTHNHADHVFGARVFAEGPGKVRVIAHRTTLEALDRIISVVRPTIYRRSMRQFGTLLPSGGVVNAGIGPRLRFDNKATIALLRPTETFSGRQRVVSAAGLELVLEHAPGETADQIMVWLPRRRVLLCGDNFYWSFPNLYAIRGTRSRDVLSWVRALDRMRDLRPRVLVPGHGRPIKGEARILRVLTDYRDAIQYVHDQTVRGMNQGLRPDALVERIKLPPRLARRPYLQQVYGKVDWSVRAIYHNYLGWFDGDAANLNPLPARQRARRLVRLAGGAARVLAAAERALAAGEAQWTLELASLVRRADADPSRARALRARALSALAGQQTNANARSYLLTQALEARGELTIGPARTTQVDAVHATPLEAIFRAMSVSLDPELSSDTDTVVAFIFPDVGKAFTLHVRRGVAEVRPRRPPRADITVTMPSVVWKEIVSGLSNPVLSYIGSEVEVQGSLLQLIKVLRMFKKD